MKVLVTHASSHGSTSEIAREIGAELSRAGLEVTVLPMDHVKGTDEFDAFILGSAVYFGHWMKNAIRFVETNSEKLKRMPVWLFSSGPIGDDPQPKNDPAPFNRLILLTNAREHAMFNGKLVRSQLNLCERLAVGLVKAEDGDFRDWPTIRDWAHEVALALEREHINNGEPAQV